MGTDLSQRTLTETENRVLAQVLDFAITPTNIPQEKYILATESALQKIQDLGKQSELRNTVAGILRAASLSNINITKEERKAITSQKKKTKPSSNRPTKAERQLS